MSGELNTYRTGEVIHMTAFLSCALSKAAAVIRKIIRWHGVVTDFQSDATEIPIEIQTVASC